MGGGGGGGCGGNESDSGDSGSILFCLAGHLIPLRGTEYLTFGPPRAKRAEK